jgi:hypothetical protein
MPRRNNPATTGTVHLPWGLADQCPCGSGSRYVYCCRQLDGSPYKKIVDYKPPGGATGHSHPGCYMNWTNNCSPKISGEHFISETVLEILNPKSLRIGGLAWIPVGETRDLPLQALKANVLCERHNSAWSQLDQMAGQFFRALREVYDDLMRPSLSRKPIWHLFSGEELELWLLKSILGLFHADVLTKAGSKIADVQTIMNSAIEAAYANSGLMEPCGLYIFKAGTTAAELGKLEFTSLSDEHDERVVGCRLAMMGLVATLITDPHMRNRQLFEERESYRPDYLLYHNHRRHHSIVLTWPIRRPFRRAVDFAMHPRPAKTK